MPNLVRTSYQQPIFGGPPILCEDSSSFYPFMDIHALSPSGLFTASEDYFAFSNESDPNDPTERVHAKTAWRQILFEYLTAIGDLLYQGSFAVPQRLAIGGTAGMVLGVNSAKTAPEWVKLKVSCGWQIESPAASDDGLIALFPVGLGYNIEEIRHAISGGTNVVFNLEKRTSPFSSGTDVWSSDKTASSSSWTSVTSFDSGSVPSGSCLATKITSVSGSVNWLAIGAVLSIEVHN